MTATFTPLPPAAIPRFLKSLPLLPLLFSKDTLEASPCLTKGGAIPFKWLWACACFHTVRAHSCRNWSGLSYREAPNKGSCTPPAEVTPSHSLPRKATAGQSKEREDLQFQAPLPLELVHLTILLGFLSTVHFNIHLFRISSSWQDVCHQGFFQFLTHLLYSLFLFPL